METLCVFCEVWIRVSKTNSKHGNGSKQSGLGTRLYPSTSIFRRVRKIPKSDY